jgi:hypothetical protein
MQPLIHSTTNVRLTIFVILLSVSVLTSPSNSQEPDMPKLGQKLTNAQVEKFARLTIENIHKQYPNKTGDVLAGAEAVRSPKELHPAFYGCFDWHSSVHGHWMLVKLLKEYPEHPIANEIRENVARNITAQKLAAELEYFSADEHKQFERTYGWAWYLKLVAELDQWDDDQGRKWREHLRPLEELLVQRTIDYLPVLSWPIRTGVHADTGFGLAWILDYARVVKNQELENAIVARAKDFFFKDTDYPTRYEPSGQDFFSSCLNEADLMRRVLGAKEFSEWFDEYLPTLKSGDGGNLLEPVTVSDVTDGYIVHLAGLNLSRAWCLEGIASALPQEDARIKLLRRSAQAHADKGFGYVFSGSYAGEHWLATFAVYLLSRSGLR